MHWSTNGLRLARLRDVVNGTMRVDSDDRADGRLKLSGLAGLRPEIGQWTNAPQATKYLPMSRLQMLRQVICQNEADKQGGKEAHRLAGETAAGTRLWNRQKVEDTAPAESHLRLTTEGDGHS